MPSAMLRAARSKDGHSRPDSRGAWYTRGGDTPTPRPRRRDRPCPAKRPEATIGSRRPDERRSLMIENPIRWPNGYRCAVNFSFDMDAESLLHIYFPDTAPNRVSMASRLRYGPEVAVPRIVDAFGRFGIRQTFFVP